MALRQWDWSGSLKLFFTVVVEHPFSQFWRLSLFSSRGFRGNESHGGPMTSNFIEIQFEKLNWKEGRGEKRNSTTDGPLKSCFLIIDVDDAFLYVKKSCVFHIFTLVCIRLYYTICSTMCVCIDRRCWGRIWKTALEMHWCRRSYSS